MNRLSFLLITILIVMQTSCASKNEDEAGYSPQVQTLSSNRLTPEILWMLGRISGESVSPDQTKVLYTVTYYSVEEDKGYSDLYLYDIVTEETKRISNTKVNEGGATWRPDGTRIGFLSNESGARQLWEMDPDGKNRKQITFIDEGISGFKYSPSGEKIALAIRIKLDQSVKDMYPDLPKANARLESDLMYRHWDTWHDYKYNHLFIAEYSEDGIFEANDIMAKERFSSPTEPFGGMADVAWSPNGELLAYVFKKKTGKEYAFSTNSEIWMYDVSTEKTSNFTEGILGYDMHPVFSPDGKYLAWESMARDGYESDQARLMIANIETGERTNLFNDFEESAQNITWSADGNSIYFISDVQATDEIFKINVVDHEITRITNGVHNYKSIQFAGNYLVARKQSMSYPDELFIVDQNDGSDSPITQVNKSIFEQLELGKVEKRWVKTTDNKDMLVWVILPPNFDAQKKYPALLYCQGGPQGTVSQFWSYRWNFQLMAANDYIIVAPNRRGLPGFGMEWLEQISKDYGGQNIQDYLSAIDDVAKEPYVDAQKLGAIGASYGGFSVFYLAGHHQKRFSAFVSHCGIFNFEQMYATTEEMWFVNWDLGGPWWDKDNVVAQRSYSFSPHKYVDKWDTPILVIHGENDFRIPYTQGMAAYNTAIMRGIPAQYLNFHDENHWVLKPQNGLLWHRTFFNWLDKWLK